MRANFDDSAKVCGDVLPTSSPLALNGSAHYIAGFIETNQGYNVDETSVLESCYDTTILADVLLTSGFDNLNNNDVEGAYEKLLDFLVDANIKTTGCPQRVQARLSKILENTVDYCNVCKLRNKTLSDYE